jgi:hypothetical protein
VGKEGATTRQGDGPSGAGGGMGSRFGGNGHFGDRYKRRHQAASPASPLADPRRAQQPAALGIGSASSCWRIMRGNAPVKVGDRIEVYWVG